MLLQYFVILRCRPKMAYNVIICEPRTSNAQRYKKHQNTENLSESIFQISLNQNLTNHQMKTFILETIQNAKYAFCIVSGSAIQNAHFLHPSFLSSMMISSPTTSVT